MYNLIAKLCTIRFGDYTNTKNGAHFSPNFKYFFVTYHLQKNCERFLYKPEKQNDMVINLGTENSILNQYMAELRDCQIQKDSMRFRRNLEPSEIISQFKTVLAEAGHIDSIVFMGMGEPFLNWDNVKRAILILSDPKAFSFSQGKITVSTVGIMPVIEELISSDLKIKLAVSVITSSDEKREKIAPMQKKYPISRVLSLVRRYVTAKQTQILAEYILFEGVNDSLEDADSLIRLLDGIDCRVNLIPVNRGVPAEGVDRIAQAKNFQQRLMDAGFRTYLRLEKGADISAACGQLAAGHKTDN